MCFCALNAENEGRSCINNQKFNFKTSLIFLFCTHRGKIAYVENTIQSIYIPKWGELIS